MKNLLILIPFGMALSSCAPDFYHQYASGLKNRNDCVELWVRHTGDKEEDVGTVQDAAHCMAAWDDNHGQGYNRFAPAAVASSTMVFDSNNHPAANIEIDEDGNGTITEFKH